MSETRDLSDERNRGFIPGEIPGFPSMCKKMESWRFAADESAAPGGESVSKTVYTAG
jgi:hypothetical protein